MDYLLFGFFSGFPNYRFPREVAKRLSEELTNRDSLVFVSAWPADYARNDSDSDGMHSMFEEYNIPFARHYVIKVLSTLLQISMELPIYAIEDDSAIFVTGDRISYTGQIHWVRNGKIYTLSIP